LNKKLILIPIIIIGAGIFAGIGGFMFVQNTSVEAVETDEFQENVELVQNTEPEQKEGRVITIEIHDGVGSSDKIN